METQTIIALAGLTCGIVGAVWNLHRILDTKLDSLAKDLHSRVSGLRDDMAQDYLRRDLWEVHFRQLEKGLAEVGADVKQLLHGRHSAE